MTRPLTMAAEGLVRHRFTVSDLDRMTAAGILAANERYELLDGEIVPMSPQYTRHGRLSTKLALWLGPRIDTTQWEMFCGVTMELSTLSRVDPDIYVARAGIASEVVPAGKVQWVIEVSDATRWRDLNVKAPIYGAAGIPELWVVDVEARLTHIHRGPSADGWTEPVLVLPFDAEIAPRMFPDLKLTLAAL